MLLLNLAGTYSSKPLFGILNTGALIQLPLSEIALIFYYFTMFLAEIREVCNKSKRKYT
jgi:hypothetical protein